ncbi:hypothetical protein BKA82DRAFT_4353441 [Pisolithus tinctorius]|nr:hypothetical protein BKA82DRAFT_4353441 [Pisolithus tinctorius]
MTIPLQVEDAYLVFGQSHSVGRHVVKQSAKGDAISMLDTMQRHGGVLFCRARITDEQDVLDIVQRHGSVSFSLGNITDEWEALDISNKADATCVIWAVLLEPGMEDPSVFIKPNIKGTWITAGIHMLICMSAVSIVFIGTDIVNIDK